MKVKAGRTYAGSFLALVLVAAVLRMFLTPLGAETLATGAGWRFHAWLGFAAPIGFMAQLYSDKPFSAFLIDTGYQLVYLDAMGAVFGVWH
jgi:hypothetical protein